MNFDLKNQNKFNISIAKLLNELYKTNDFEIINKDSINQLNHIKSVLKKTLVTTEYFNFKLSKTEKLEIAFSSLNLNINQVEKDKSINKLIIITDEYQNSVFYEYIQYLKNINNYSIDIELWTWEIINSYSKSYPHIFTSDKNNKKKNTNNFYITLNKSKFSYPEFLHNHIKELLFTKQEKIINLYSNIPSSGKTIFLKNLLFELQQNKIIKNHLYLNCSVNLKYELCLKIKQQYGIHIKNEKQYKNHLINTLKNKNINLIVIDNYNDSDYNDLKKILLIACPIIISTNKKVNIGIKIKYELFKNEKDTQKFLPKINDDTEKVILTNILEKINYHPYLIQVIKKTLQNPYSINQIYILLKEKDKRIPHLRAYINSDYEASDIKKQKDTYKYFLAIFDDVLSNFTNNEKKIIRTLSLLPTGYYDLNQINDLLFINKSENLSELLLKLNSCGFIDLSNKYIGLTSVFLKMTQKRLKPNPINQKVLINKLTEFLTKANNPIAHVNFAEHILILFEKNKKTIHLGFLIIEIAQFHHSFGDILKATLYFNKAEEIFESNLDLHNKPKVSNTLISIYQQNGKYNEALSLALKQHEVLTEIYDELSIEIGNSYNTIAYIYHLIEKYEEAIENIENAIFIYQQNHYNNLSEIKNFHEILTQCLIKQNNLNEKKIWFNKYFK